MVERVWRCTWRLCSSKFGDELGGRKRASLEIHLAAVVERVCRCTWRPWLSEFERGNRVSLEMNLEAVIKGVWRCAWRPRSSGFGDAQVGGRNRASLDDYLEVVDAWCTGCADSTHLLVNLQP